MRTPQKISAKENAQFAFSQSMRCSDWLQPDAILAAQRAASPCANGRARDRFQARRPRLPAQDARRRAVFRNMVVAHLAVAAAQAPRAAMHPAFWLRAALLSVLALLALAAPAAPLLEVQAQRNGDLIDVQAHALVRADLKTVWATLTDYEHAPEFVPGMATSRIVGRNGAATTVAQTGAAQLLFLSFPIDVTLEVTERPPHVLEVRRVAGTLRYLKGRYEATPLAGASQVSLRWIGSVSPETGLPPLIGTALVRLLIERQFQGMVDEIERRAGVIRPATPEPQRGNR